MSENFKPATDRTINDVNRANREAWDSGEFKHTQDTCDCGDTQPEGSTSLDKAVHLPRRSTRTWRQRNWS